MATEHDQPKRRKSIRMVPSSVRLSHTNKHYKVTWQDVRLNYQSGSWRRGPIPVLHSACRKHRYSCNEMASLVIEKKNQESTWNRICSCTGLVSQRSVQQKPQSNHKHDESRLWVCGVAVAAVAVGVVVVVAISGIHRCWCCWYWKSKCFPNCVLYRLVVAHPKNAAELASFAFGLM